MNKKNLVILILGMMFFFSFLVIFVDNIIK